MYKGACMCGGVQFEIHGKISDIVYCHCSQCRKAQGSAFATNGVVKKTDFRFLSGEQLLAGYESSPGKTKYFCRQCGSPIFSKNSSLPQLLRIRLGTIDGELDVRPGCHIFVGSKANWHAINDDLPQYPEFAVSKEDV